MNFEWDLDKELANIKKHRFSFSDAVDSFKDPSGFVLEDKKHSNIEKRFYWVGKSSKGIVLTSRFTWRGENIRIFGCAKWREYQCYYHEKTKNK